MPASKTLAKKNASSTATLTEQYLHHVWVDFDDLKSVHTIKNVKSKRTKKVK